MEKDEALINRLGFNNHGMDIVKKRILENSPKGILGVNIGPNKDTVDKKDDFEKGLKHLHDVSSYITINISSPNTEGLRDFHQEDIFEKLIKSLNLIRNKNKVPKPIVLKLSPDITDQNMSNIIEVLFKYKIDGVILSNTSEKCRDSLIDKKKFEKGGLSGKPIRNLSTDIIKKFYKELKGQIPIIGVGGVNSGQSALEKILAGANAIQLYTGMVYEGPGIVKNIKEEMITFLQKEKIKNISEIVGAGN